MTLLSWFTIMPLGLKVLDVINVKHLSHTHTAHPHTKSIPTHLTPLYTKPISRYTPDQSCPVPNQIGLIPMML